eukprot:531659_1
MESTLTQCINLTSNGSNPCTDFRFTIDESIPSYIPLNLSTSNLQLFLICTMTVLSTLSFIICMFQFHRSVKTITSYSKIHKKHTMSLLSDKYTTNYLSIDRIDNWTDHRYSHNITKMTATETIYNMFSKYSINKVIINLILLDYCGYENPPEKESIISRKHLMKNKKKSVYKCIWFKLCVSHLLLIILISSLLFATYCGIIFLIQNDKYLKTYSVFMECDCVENSCLVSDIAFVYDGGFKKPYESFYQDIFIPYLERYEPELMKKEKYQNNSGLYLDNDDMNSCSTGEYTKQRYKEGWLYLSENGLSDSRYLYADDSRFVENDAESGKKGCSCCVCWTGFAVFCLILITLLLLIALYYFFGTWEDFIISETERFMKDISHIMQEINDIDQKWSV